MDNKKNKILNYLEPLSAGLIEIHLVISLQFFSDYTDISIIIYTD